MGCSLQDRVCNALLENPANILIIRRFRRGKQSIHLYPARRSLLLTNEVSNKPYPKGQLQARKGVSISGRMLIIYAMWAGTRTRRRNRRSWRSGARCRSTCTSTWSCWSRCTSSQPCCWRYHCWQQPDQQSAGPPLPPPTCTITECDGTGSVVLTAVCLHCPHSKLQHQSSANAGFWGALHPFYTKRRKGGVDSRLCAPTEIDSAGKVSSMGQLCREEPLVPGRCCTAAW